MQAPMSARPLTDAAQPHVKPLPAHPITVYDSYLHLPGTASHHAEPLFPHNSTPGTALYQAPLLTAKSLPAPCPHTTSLAGHVEAVALAVSATTDEGGDTAMDEDINVLDHDTDVLKEEGLDVEEQQGDVDDMEDDDATEEPFSREGSVTPNGPPPLHLTAAAAAATAHPLTAIPKKLPSPKAPPTAPHPDWPTHIVGIEFFGACPAHPGFQKNECNFYCVGCGPIADTPMCRHCLPAHDACCAGPCHQVYRYMHHDVIRTATFGPLHPLAEIQYYKANAHNAVHLRPKGPPRTKSPKYFTANCGGCDRSINPGWTFCSLACKLGIEDTLGGGAGAGPRVGAAGRKQGGGSGHHPPRSAATGASQQWDHHHSSGGCCYAGIGRSRSGTPPPANEPLVGAKRRKCASPQRSAEA